MGKKREKRTRGKTAKWLWLWITGGVLVCLAGTYFVAGLYFSGHFFPNVSINGRDVSYRTTAQVKEDICEESETYALHIYTRGGGEEVLYGADFDLRFRYDDTLSELLEGQQLWKWGIHLFVPTEYEVPVLAEYDEEKLKDLTMNLACLDSENMTAPKNAYIDYDTQEGLYIVPEEKGSKILVKAFKKEVVSAVQNARIELSAEELNLYVEPKVNGDDEELNAAYNLWKPYLDTKIVYQFGDNTETLDATMFYEWISVDEKGIITFDSEQIKDYIRGLARKYNTAYSPKILETSYGETVTISSGPYGWQINQPKEAEALEEALLACESQEREPIYTQRAASYTGNDYGDTYVEVNLSAQHLFFYKDGELLVESDFVSGNESRGWGTPDGAYPLTYKERNATLKGQGYATPVSYWMPFNGNIGLHDSSWRSNYGKNIYKTNGSHGCINLPPAVAEIIYENIEQGVPVLCYHLSGTEYISTEPEETPEVVETEPELDPEAVVVSPETGVVIPGVEAAVPDVLTVIPDMGTDLPGDTGISGAVLPDGSPAVAP